MGTNCSQHAPWLGLSGGSRLLRAAVLLTGVNTLAACIEIGADIPQTCFLRSNLGFAAATPQADDGVPGSWPEVKVTQTFTQDGLEEIPESVGAAGAAAEVAVSFIEVERVEGSVSFVDLGEISLWLASADRSQGLRPVRVAGCRFEAEDCLIREDALRLEGDDGVDLFPYLAGGTVELTLEIAGSPAVLNSPFRLDVDVCLSGAASASYGL